MRTPSWTKFMIPTKTESLSSGFPYDERLAALRISHENWFQFSSSIVKASKLTAKEDFAAWTTGITTGTLSSPFLLVFAPMVGIWAGKKVHRKTLQSNVEEKLTGDGDLRSILRNWNEHEFSKNGFQAWLEVPSTTGKNSSKRFSILIVPDDGMSPAAQPSLMPLHHPGLVEADAQQDIRELDGTQVEPARESRSIRRLQLTSTSNPVSRTNSPALPHAGYTDTKSGEIRHELE
ncbi:hypothetical protein BJ875DRAFT_463137 [Amylocarpus encephaloides]|uniref:Uncharacterized protein n=1 Tax=Amylocarpus encephaloides TaxID=45428 RepID=A0A9P7YHX7_9HELO|nr:hypothetical protein BJ875DRAFT_463137 [Amylocarpus encephaloides]